MKGNQGDPGPSGVKGDMGDVGPPGKLGEKGDQVGGVTFYKRFILAFCVFFPDVS